MSLTFTRSDRRVHPAHELRVGLALVEALVDQKLLGTHDNIPKRETIRFVTMQVSGEKGGDGGSDRAIDHRCFRPAGNPASLTPPLSAKAVPSAGRIFRSGLRISSFDRLRWHHCGTQVTNNAPSLPKIICGKSR
ncbi:hypothetical protein EGT36_30140 [Agrobacterium sp. FDAARGOS_525]|uniref:hypothetical protein n=1 Tax=Agrobacterium sp. FDAARGOS_525 TaxID=2420311 RepID=UPI000F65DDA9|nr:hypothetical protein [Agrobacterium sp. FDAARGOS_525]RSC21451.1 hypothetical protein EGT36_30140 [Agrobacterium sp. FDAARGOS_525]